MLHCQIATASDLSLVRNSISRPNESIVEYSKLRHPYATPLCAVLTAKFGDMEVLSGLFAFAREATSQLGEWCADHFWSMALAEQESLKIERKLERSFVPDGESRPIHLLDAELNRIREAKNVVREWMFFEPTLEENILSPKVLLLHRYLKLIFEKPSNDRCIIFVKRRYTARLLATLFARIGSPLIRIGLLIGTRYGDPGDDKISFRQQVLTLTKFRKGEINCLVRFCHFAKKTLRF
jgi:endoribonuclease Dicer